MAAREPAATKNELLHGADAIGLTSATPLTRTRVVTIPTAVGALDIRKRCSIPTCVEVHAITDRSAIFDGIGEDSNHGA